MYLSDCLCMPQQLQKSWSFIYHSRKHPLTNTALSTGDHANPYPSGGKSLHIYLPYVKYSFFIHIHIEFPLMHTHCKIDFFLSFMIVSVSRLHPG